MHNSIIIFPDVVIIFGQTCELVFSPLLLAACIALSLPVIQWCLAPKHMYIHGVLSIACCFLIFAGQWAVCYALYRVLPKVQSGIYLGVEHPFVLAEADSSVY